MNTDQALPLVKSLSQPFSNFDFVEEHFAASFTIRKIFSLARSRGAQTLIAEDQVPTGVVEDENRELSELFSDYTPGRLVQITFWSGPFIALDCVADLKSSDCVGYALLKQDIVPSRSLDQWHVFEAVVACYPHHHSYFKACREYHFTAGGRAFSLFGCLFAQQNGLNKACAQVALRSLSTSYLRRDVSYREINDFASNGDPAFKPASGLTNDEIRWVLTGLLIPYNAWDYTAWEEKPGMENIRSEMPYQKMVYSGVESGCGALIAFRTKGPNANPKEGHVVTAFGHTFNEDSWAPYGDGAYFKIGEEIKYLPSRAWTSNFIIHDDNFGANLCLPQSFLNTGDVHFVIELLRDGWPCSGVVVEITAANYFYSILPTLDVDGVNPISVNPIGIKWLRRLQEYVSDQQLILRHVPVTREEYLQRLEEDTDWQSQREDAKVLSDLQQADFPSRMWMVEVSVPEVFSTNKRKIGEILLDGERAYFTDEADGSGFVVARFPGCYVFFDTLNDDGIPLFRTVPSGFGSHLPLFGTSTGEAG